MSLLKKLLSCFLITSLIFLSSYSFRNLTSGIINAYEPEVDESANSSDPAINWIVYPNSQFYTDGLNIALCKEAVDMSEAWMEEPAISLEPKYAHCVGMSYDNPYYRPDGWVEVTHFIRETNKEGIANWFIGELTKRKWELCNKHSGPIPRPCSETDPTYTTLSFCRGGRMREVQIDLLSQDGCGEGAGEYFNLGTLITVKFKQSLVIEEPPVTPMPFPTPKTTPTAEPIPEEICEYPAEEEGKRQEIIARVKQELGFEIKDSDLCGLETCDNNSLWGETDLLEIEETLKILPDCFLSRIGKPEIRGRPGGNSIYTQVWENKCCVEESVAGYLPPEKKITLCDRAFEEYGYGLGESILHELVHVFQYSGASTPAHGMIPPGAYTNKTVIKWLNETGWAPTGICLPVIGCPGVTLELPPDLPTDYTRKTKDPLEDMAESVRVYVANPNELLSVSPRRYNFVRDNLFCGKEYK